MNPKTKISLIIGGILTFILGWGFFVINSLSTGDNTDNKTNIINKKPKKIEYKNNNKEKKTNEKEEEKDKKKLSHQIDLMYPKFLIGDYTKKIFSYKYKKKAGGNINYKPYTNLEKYKKLIKYKIKKKQFDLAIIPSERFKEFEGELKSFNLEGANLDFINIFDYNFAKYVKNNNIKAIPFAIDPIVGYANNKKNDIKTKQTIQTWKNLIITEPNRIKGKNILKMPVFLGYDQSYLNYIKTNDSLFPIFDYIVKYYLLKNASESLSTIKDFGTNLKYKTFSNKTYKILSKKIQKYKFCKGKEKFCFILNGTSKIIYDFVSNENFYKENKINIYKNFKIKPNQIKATTLPIKNFDEYPARGYIIIINPQINTQKIGTFLQNYMELGRNGELPFYKKIISPFLGKKINQEKFEFLNNYIGRFIFLENFTENKKIPEKLRKYFLGKININLLF